MIKRLIRPGLAVGYLLTAGLVFISACAIVEAPPGGPVDTEPPFVAFVFPDSGMTGLAGTQKLQIAFSEKMDRQPAISWLHFFPDQRIKKTKWKGATIAQIELEEPLPPDTLIVVEIAAGMRDAHKVKSRTARRYPLATGDTIAAGSLSGVLIIEDGPVTTGIIELYGLEPDSLEYFQRPLIRRTATNEQGAYRFDWLPVPGGPWVARAFSSKDGSLRPGDRDPQRLIPDTLRVTAEQIEGVVGITTLYPFDTPGRLLTGPFPVPGYEGQVMVFTSIISDMDTGYVAIPAKPLHTHFSYLDPDTGGVVTRVKPGINRLITFIDIDADSSFSVVPDSLLGSEIASLTDTVSWYLEPWTMLEGVTVEPGLPTDFIMPAWTDSLTPGVAPPVPVAPVVLTDSLGVALPDSLILAPDSKPETETEKP